MAKRNYPIDADADSSPACKWTDALAADWFAYSHPTQLTQFFPDVPHHPELSTIQSKFVEEWPLVFANWEKPNYEATSVATRKFWLALVDADGAGKPESYVHDFLVELFRLVFEQFNVRTRIVHSQPKYKLFHAGVYSYLSWSYM
jgi:hypothetical protein